MKLWSGRFTKPTDELTEDFNASIAFDKRLYRQDIKGSIAHAEMLARQNIISLAEKNQIVQALEEIEQDIASGRISFTIEAEDVHMNIETFLIAKLGETGKKLHTARSRNDQVALDVRMYLRDEIEQIKKLLLDWGFTLLDLASDHIYTIMPGYTHLQKAQPITLAHHLLAYFEMMRRDMGRLSDCNQRTDYMPLGSGALAGTGFNLDRDYVREQLNFKHLSRNSMDSVSDRDFAIEFCSFASITMMHLSRLAEELILWSSDEFSFVEMDDAFATGSSIMPQKKNPDIAELVRGKTGRVYGHLISLLTLMKSLPLAYNKDMQEDKEALFDTIDTVKKSLLIFNSMLRSAEFKPKSMLEAAQGGFINATDLADYLVQKGLPFRQAHEITGKIVHCCVAENLHLTNLTLDKYQTFSTLIESDIYEYLDIASCVERRKVLGGPAPATVIAAIEEAKLWLRSIENELSE